MTAIRKYLEEHKHEMIGLLGELVAVPSVQGEAGKDTPFGEEPANALRLMLKNCERFGFSVENVENYAGSADINDLEPALGILTHLDVVPTGTGWSSDPFVLTRCGNKLVGRGTIDDKGPAAAAVFAARAVRELGIPLTKGVRLIFGTNEENGSADLAYYRTKRKLPPMVFTPDGEYPVINGEKGMLRVYFSTILDENVEISAGEVINAVPASCSVKIGGNTTVYRGKSAHASTPWQGENAITKFLSQYEGNSRVVKSIQQCFQHGDVEGKTIFGDNSANFTCVLSMLNTVENSLKGGIDIRYPLDRSKAEVSRIICGKLHAAGFSIDSCEGSEPHYTDESSEFVQKLLKVYEKVSGEKGSCITIGGGTYVHEIDGGVAFGAEYPGGSGNMHGADEYITVESLLKNAEIMAEAIIEICSAN